MLVFALQPGGVTTREAVLAEAAVRTGFSPAMIREKVESQINAAIANGTLLEDDRHLHTRDHATSWVLHIHQDDDSGEDSSQPRRNRT
jgi:hypothetical protein